MHRRALLGGSIGLLVAGDARRRRRTAAPAAPGLPFAYPIALPDRPPGDGFLVRHGYACENTWYNPGFLHTGEDWYRTGGEETGGARLLAVADGEVVFAGSEYPGRVVIVRHAADLYSMYGHLDYDLAVEAGEPVRRGQTLGVVFPQVGGRAPSHLHFEVRTFLTTPEVNGDAPRYGFACGPDCPPGPGYWPIGAPEHPSALGWRNPTHVLARRAYPDGPGGAGAEVVVASDPSAPETALWTRPEGEDGARRVGELPLEPGTRYPLLSVRAGREATDGTSAEAYRLWYRLSLPDGERAWVRSAVPSAADTGSDGRPSTVRFDLLPAVPADS